MKGELRYVIREETQTLLHRHDWNESLESAPNVEEVYGRFLGF